MIWIELLGPSGIGKSFIFDKVVQSGVDIGMATNKANNALLHRVLRKIQRRKRQRDFNSLILEHTVRDQHTVQTFMQGLTNYSQNPIVQLNMCDYFHYKLRDFHFQKSNLSTDGVFFSEDGILHLNYGIDVDNIEMIHMPDYVIGLTASPEYIVNNRLQRIKSGKANLIEREFSENELLNNVFPLNFEVYNKKTCVIRNFLRERYFDINVEATPLPKIITEIDEILRCIKR